MLPDAPNQMQSLCPSRPHAEALKIFYAKVKGTPKSGNLSLDFGIAIMAVIA